MCVLWEGNGNSPGPEIGFRISGPLGIRCGPEKLLLVPSESGVGLKIYYRFPRNPT